MHEYKARYAVRHGIRERIKNKRQRCYKFGCYPDPSNSYLNGPAYVAPMTLAVRLTRSVRMASEPLKLCATVDGMPQAASISTS